MSNPLISIIIPSFNAGQTISEALQSIVTQTFTHFEVLVMDGLSTDGTGKIVDSFAATDSRIRYFSEKDNGIYDAMNKGIEKAAGNWLLFLGADDTLVDKDILGKLSGKLVNTTAEFVYGNVRIRGNGLSLKEGDIYDGIFTLEKLFKKNISHQAIFYAKAAFDKLGNFNTRYRVCADWDFNHRCFSQLKVEYTDEIISVFSIGGLSTDRWDQYMEDSVVNLKRYYGIGYFNPLFKTYSWAFYHQANKEARNGRYFKALYFCFFSFIYSKELLLLTKSYLINMMNSRKKRG